MYSWETQASTLTLDYAQLADVEQAEKETPGKSLDRFGRLSTSLLTLIQKVQKKEWS